MGSYILGDILSIKLVIKSTVNSITETVVHVKNTDQIWVLSKYINDDGAQHYFIHNNNIISPAFSFEFHGIKDNSEIKIIPSSLPKRSCITRPKSAHTRNICYPTLSRLKSCFDESYKLFGNQIDQDSIQNIIETMMNPGLMNEAAKMHDQYFVKIEGNALCHRRLIKRYLNVETSEKEFKLIKANCKYYKTNERPNEPSKDALPSFWKERGKQ